MYEKPDYENTDPAYDPLDKRWMAVVWVLSLLFWGVVIFVVWPK